MPRLLVSNAENEFVSKLVGSLVEDHGVQVSALVADPTHFSLQGEGLEVVTEPVAATHALITMPTDAEAAQRAMALVDGLEESTHLLFIANELDPEHHLVTDHIKASGNPWTIVHPVAMMDFSFAALPPQVAMAGVIFGISGRSPIGFVAASDIIRVLATVLGEQGHEGQEYVCSGPEAVDMPTVTAHVSRVVERTVDYIDLPEDELASLMVTHGKQDPEVIDKLVMAHMRAWRDGRADVVTDTVERVTGVAPRSVEQWLDDHADNFTKGQSLVQKAASRVIRLRYRERIMQ
jgi:uncharacterized protein YbjT (DUF2867 family)